ncbi:hypothetical protein J6590_019646 [Homalodisca vitripennis]|nr:hypothetical protein J6590_019646 [Homalodisca vitripennis]
MTVRQPSGCGHHSPFCNSHATKLICVVIREIILSLLEVKFVPDFRQGQNHKLDDIVYGHVAPFLKVKDEDSKGGGKSTAPPLTTCDLTQCACQTARMGFI